MADNYTVKNSAGTDITIRAKEVSAGQYSPRVIPQVADADVSVSNPVPSKILLAAGVARQLTTTATSANTALTAGIRAVSIHARNSNARFSIGNTSQTASATSHFIASGERLDLDVSGFATPNIGIIFGPAAAAAVLEISELS